MILKRELVEYLYGPFGLKPGVCLMAPGFWPLLKKVVQQNLW